MAREPARSIYQGRIDILTDAIMSGDMERFAAGIALPYSVKTCDARVLYDTEDALKLVMAGADVVNVCAAILKGGPQVIGQIRDGMAAWLTEHEYESLEQARDSMNQASSPEPTAFERANYMKSLQTWA